VNANLNATQIDSFLRVLRKHCKAIGCTLDDLKRSHPSLCMHRNIRENNHKPSIEHQRILNPSIQEVVKRKILKLLKADIIYPISNSAWISPVHVVPKKRGITVIKNENNELIPRRTVTSWCMRIDY